MRQNLINYYRLAADNVLVLRQTLDSGVNQPTIGPAAGSWDLLLTSGQGAAIQASFFEPNDAFVSAFSADGSRMLASSYLGGRGREDVTWAIDVDSTADQVLVGGWTSAPDFPLGNLQLPPSSVHRFNGFHARIQMPVDTDDDGVSGLGDNCLNEPNPDQTDSDGDGYGNHCDADFNNDLIVNTIDLGQFRLQYFTDSDSVIWDPQFDLNVDGHVNAEDLGVFRARFFDPPGPSAW